MFSPLSSIGFIASFLIGTQCVYRLFFLNRQEEVSVNIEKENLENEIVYQIDG
jgi:hypothetical protein